MFVTSLLVVLATCTTEKGVGLIGPAYTTISKGKCEDSVTTKAECNEATGKKSKPLRSRSLTEGCRLTKTGKAQFVVETGNRKRRRGASKQSPYMCRGPQPKPCTRELGECPDGSMVGRDSLNNCEFSPCPTEPQPKPCTRELRQCPDGSMVGRDSLNNCEFSPCSTEPQPKPCTRELSQCPDGSMVGRDGMNNCEFAPCPTTPEPAFCTRDLKECPDGSMVGRDEMNDCEFSLCPCSCSVEKRYSGWNVGDTACEFNNGDNGVNCAPEKACGNPKGTLCTMQLVKEPRWALTYSLTPEEDFSVTIFALLGVLSIAYGAYYGFRKVLSHQRSRISEPSYSSVA